jgi:very-short-patch-repair endonuclease
VLPTRGHRREEICIHHASILQPSDRAIREGLPVTGVPRLLLDLASTVRLRTLERTLERAARLGLLDLIEIDSLLGRAGRPPGRGALRSALDLHREPAFARSGLERRFLKLVRASDLPMPAANTYVSGFELDMYWEAERFAVELDGYETHGTRAAFEQDRVRQEELKLAGIEMVRFTARRIVDEPEAVIKRLGTLLERRRRELAAAAAFSTGTAISRGPRRDAVGTRGPRRRQRPPR